MPEQPRRSPHGACQGWCTSRSMPGLVEPRRSRRGTWHRACVTVDVSRVEPGHDRLLVRFRARVRVGVGVRARIRVSITWLNLARTAGDLHGQTPRNQRLRRRRARSPEAATGRLVAGLQPGSAELPRAIRCALRRRRSRAGALPRGSNCDRAGRLHGEELLLVDGLALVRVEALLRTDGRHGDAERWETGGR